MQSKAATVAEYLTQLPEDRRVALEAVRKVILKNLDEDFEEGMQYGAIGYFVPHRIFPAGYHCDPKQPLGFACLASQKNYMSLYLMSIYGDRGEEEWLRKEWAKTGKKLDIGKSCIRFKKIEDLPLELIGQAIGRVSAAKYIARYLSVREKTGTGKKSVRPSEPIPSPTSTAKKRTTSKASGKVKVNDSKSTAKPKSGKPASAAKATPRSK